MIETKVYNKMNEQINIVQACSINPFELEHLKIEVLNSKYVVALIDMSGNEILKGYGVTIIEAINNLHSTLL